MLQLFYAPLFVTVFANLLYHFASKSVNEKSNLFFSLLIVYGIAWLICLVTFLSGSHKTSLLQEVKYLNWGTVLLGIAIVFVEVGYLWMYRSGWPVNMSAILVTSLLTLALIPIGIFIFQEPFNLKEAMGILFCLLGVYLLQ